MNCLHKNDAHCVSGGGNPMSNKSGFTLVELLVVIGIIALLMSMLLPALSKAREAGNAIKCSSNLRQIGIGLAMYANENRGWMPTRNHVMSDLPLNGFLGNSQRVMWDYDIAKYIGFQRSTDSMTNLYDATGKPLPYVGPPFGVLGCPSAPYMTINSGLHYIQVYPGTGGTTSVNATGHSAYVMNQFAIGGSSPKFFCHYRCSDASEVFAAFDGQWIGSQAPYTSYPQYAGEMVMAQTAIWLPNVTAEQNQGGIAFRHMGKNMSKSTNALYMDGHVTPVMRGNMVNWTAGVGNAMTDIADVNAYGSTPTSQYPLNGPPWIPSIHKTAAAPYGPYW